MMSKNDTYICAKESIKRTENRQKVIAEGDFLAGEMLGCLKRYSGPGRRRLFCLSWITAIA